MVLSEPGRSFKKDLQGTNMAVVDLDIYVDVDLDAYLDVDVYVCIGVF